jgi:1,4-dihydroxy-2-naphthoyl-CoA hydrolase
MKLRPELDVSYFNNLSRGHLPEHLGVKVTRLAQGVMGGNVEVEPKLMAPNGFLHAGTVVTLADTLAGYACVAHLPEGAIGFTTLELKSNFLGTAREGRIAAEATAVHLGRTTHVWDAIVWRGAERTKPIAVFRCTQLVLYPR